MLTITRTAYAVDCMTGDRLRYRIRNWTIVAGPVVIPAPAATANAN